MIKTTLQPVNGFLFSSIHAGIKKKRKDLSLIYCPEGAVCAGTFTTNKTKAAPVVYSEALMKKGHPIKAVVINSGNANACTGMKGYDNAVVTANTIAELLAIDPQEVLLSSTGIIGVQLPMDKLLGGLPEVASALTANGLGDVAEGILTTDTTEKTFSTTFKLPSSNQLVTLSGIAKGSGMIHPNMATMLSFVFTDIAIDPSALKKMTSSIVDETFNMVTVDGDTSTNDMFLVMASGALGNPVVTEGSLDYEIFKSVFLSIAKALAISIAKDGEGASKLLQVKLQGGYSLSDARTLAKSVISSSLVKAAFFGMDANWGRIICALGYAGVPFDPDKLNLSFESTAGHIQMMENGVGLIFDEDLALKVLSEPIIDILIHLQDGEHEAEAWGCDLTYEYVKINGAYRT
jgi:glutamate N-acetyltransferase/amino-acid N-acetyltransferase